MNFPAIQKPVMIEGVDHPLCHNVDAYCLFEESTGKDYTQLKATSMLDTSRLLWCLLVAGARRQDREFPYSFDQFRRVCDMEILSSWMNACAEAAAEEPEEGEKKSR